MEQLEQIIGYTFQNKKLLRQRCNGSNIIGSERLARISIPADNSVA